MRRRTWLAMLGALPFLGGCAGANHTERDAKTGALIGGTSGAVLGQAAGGNPLVGGLIGLVGGTIIGGAIGNEEDKRENAEYVQAKNEADSRALHGAPLGLTDIIQLAQKNVGDEIVITQIRTTRSTFQLSAEDLRFLKENNVSDRVILEMQNRRPENALTPRYVPVHHHPRPQYIYGPPPPPPHWHYWGPPPPPPPGIGVGFVIR